MARVLEKRPQFIIKQGRLTGVIIDLEDYRKLLERLEDVEDLAELRKIREKPLKIRPFEEFLKEIGDV